MSNEKTGTVRVVSAIADQTQVVLYKEDGSTLILKQGDHRLQALMDHIIPITTRGEVAVVDLDKFSVYADFEKQTGGVVRFFKTARQALGSMLGQVENKEVVIINMEFAPDIAPSKLGKLLDQVEQAVMPYTKNPEPVLNESGSGLAIPERPASLNELAYKRASIGDSVRISHHSVLSDGWYVVCNVRENSTGQRLQVNSSKGNFWIPDNRVRAWRYAEDVQNPQQPMLAAVDMEIGSHSDEGGKTTETVVTTLQPMGDSDLIEDDETVVAIIDGIMIPNVDKLKPIILHSVRSNSANSVKNFLKRAAAIISQRAHSVLDLMLFLEKGDLPLTEDGAIIAYKILRKARGEEGIFVDCHSGKVRQRVGSYVCVDEKLVDRNRRNECSNGLHIARRGYLGSFSGDVCVLTKIDPEDVMVVPHGDPNKVRVKGYHILAELSDDTMSRLKRNLPMTGEHAAMVHVSDAIKGNHIRRIEEVRIHGQMGADVVITPIAEQGKRTAKRKTAEVELSAKDKKQASALDDPENASTAIPPREINKRVNAEVEKTRSRHSQADSKGVPTPGQSAATKAKKEVNPPSGTKVANGDKSQKTQAKSSGNTPTEKAKVNQGKSAAKDKAPVTSADAALKEKLPPEQYEALSLVWSGVSQSETSRKTGVSRRTIGRLTDQYGTKAPT